MSGYLERFETSGSGAAADPCGDQLKSEVFRAERDQARQDVELLQRKVECLEDHIENLNLEIGWAKDRMRGSVPREAHERRLRHIRACEEALRKRNARIRELENAACERHTVRAEDHEAAEWVRKHGGLVEANKQWENMTEVVAIVGEALWIAGNGVPNRFDMNELRAELFSRLMPAGYEWDDRLAGAVDFFESMHDLLYTVDCEEDHDGPEMVKEVMRRLMPKGTEWPRFEDGEPVRIGDVVSGVEVRSVVFRDTGILLSDCTSVPGWGTWRSYKEPIKRSAHKKIGADGMEVRVGETVWGVQTGTAYVVDGFVTDGSHGEYTVEAHNVDGLELAYLMPSYLTHCKPVIAADGRPVVSGEHAYLLDSGMEVVIGEMCGEDTFKAFSADTGAYLRSVQASEIAHERPDSWERLWEDAAKSACAYFNDRIIPACSQCSMNKKGDCDKEKEFDLVRRAKALAERGQ